MLNGYIMAMAHVFIIDTEYKLLLHHQYKEKKKKGSKLAHDPFVLNVCLVAEA